MSAMVKSNKSRVPQGLSNSLKPTKSEGIPYRQFFETIYKAMPVELGVMISSVPRGGLQVAQPQRVPEGFLKGYSREFHAEDRLSWQAILKGQPVTGTQAISGYENSKYRAF